MGSDRWGEKKDDGGEEEKDVGWYGQQQVLSLLGRPGRQNRREGRERGGEDGRARSAVRLPFLPSRTLPAGCNRG